jgi:poly(3-hydroxybutyrate) depolymerase
VPLARYLRRPARRLASAAVALLAFGSAIFPSTAHAPVASAAAPPGKISVLRLHLPWARSVTRDVWVYRPPVPDSSTLPVLYFLHGIPGSATDPFKAGLAASLDSWFSKAISRLWSWRRTATA